MTGILEQIRDAIMANTAAINAHAMLAGASPAALTAQPGALGLLSTVVTPALAAAASPPDTNMTAQAIGDLIQPHISNEAVKAALGDAMRGMGIMALPEAQPHQYNALYAAFQGVLSRFGIGAPAGAPASASII